MENPFSSPHKKKRTDRRRREEREGEGQISKRQQKRLGKGWRNVSMGK